MKRKIIALLFAGALLGSITLAFAADYKSYPGSMCLTQGLGMDEDFWYDSSSSGRHYGAYKNSESISVNAVCPIVSDERKYSAGEVVVYNPNSDIFICNLYIVDPTGVGSTWSDSETTVGSGVQTLTFDTLGDPNYSKAIHYIRCNVPAGASVLRYSVTEDGGDLSI